MLHGEKQRRTIRKDKRDACKSSCPDNNTLKIVDSTEFMTGVFVHTRSIVELWKFLRLLNGQIEGGTGRGDLNDRGTEEHHGIHDATCDIRVGDECISLTHCGLGNRCFDHPTVHGSRYTRRR